MAGEIAKTTYRVSDFLAWQKHRTLILNPAFQRRPVWKVGAKSYLVDTVIRGLPMPLIFLRDRPSRVDTLEPDREVVDGQQRIRTLIGYIAPETLDDLKPADHFFLSRAHNREFAGRSFPELPDEMRQRILDYQFSVHVFPADTDDRDILQIFARMNATGVRLNEQELRNAEHFGEFKTLMYTLAAEQLSRWRNWSVFTDYNIARMEEVELSSEFAQLMIRGIAGRSQRALDNLYAEYDDLFPEGEEVARRFRYVFDSIDDKFRKDLRRSPFRRKTLFYSLFAAFYDTHFGMGSSLKSARPRSMSPKRLDWIREAGQAIRDRAAPEAVLDATSLRTTHVSSRTVLFEFLRR
jgi:Protein of unknown function DUF262